GNANKRFPENRDEWSIAEKMLTGIAVLCNDSYINKDGKEIGDPTEIALINFANSNQIDYEEMRETYPRLAELPFDSDRKLMSTVHMIDGRQLMLTKGAPDVMFSRAAYVLVNGEEQPVNEDMLEHFQEANEEFSNQALRGLA